MDKRADPKKYLEYIQFESVGKLKIFLGAAPGVGKTYTMLEEAVVRKKEGLDVVVGLVETHGRTETEAFLANLEVLPRRILSYREIEIKEFDLDAALARKPSLILVDEMAHANVPGARHKKRWQDIFELLDRGINVYTTLNVQHIESLNNIITQITGIVVRETVPDTVIDRARAIELIDLPPDDLIKRLVEGKIYLPSDISTATEHFFQKSNLSALRELALRITADKVDIEVLLYKKGESIKKILPATERLLVCVGPDIDSLRLIRSTFRMAKSLHAKWIAVTIETPKLHASEESRQKIMQYLVFAEQLGGETLIIGGTDIATEIVNLAHEHNVTKIILGKKIKSRWKELFNRSLANDLVRQSIDIDLYILRGNSSKDYSKLSNAKKTATLKTTYFLGFLTVIICSVINIFFYTYMQPSSIMLLYLLGIIFVSTKGHKGTAYFTSILSVITINFLFITPLFSLNIQDPKDLIALLGMLLVSLLVAHFTVLTKLQADSMRIREKRIAAIDLLNKQLARTRGLEQLLKISVKHLSEVFNCNVLVLMPDKDLNLIPTGRHGDKQLDQKEQSVAQWVYELGQIAGYGTETLPDNKAIYIPLIGTKGPIGVLQVLPKEQSQQLLPEQLHFLEWFSNQIAMALEVDRLQEDAKKAELQKVTDQVRNVIMKYISDIMREPLVDIMNSSNGLIEISRQLNSNIIEALGNNIYNNSEEINHLINNISQIAQLESSEFTLTKKPHSLHDVALAALKSLTRRIKHRPIYMRLPNSFPNVPFNKVFLEHVFFNIIENAIKYTPSNSPIDISGILETERVVISIADHGPGLALQEIKRIFLKFYRGQTNIKGMGLGLAICQKIITIHGGEIWAENRPEGGAVFRFTLPIHL